MPIAITDKYITKINFDINKIDITGIINDITTYKIYLFFLIFSEKYDPIMPPIKDIIMAMLKNTALNLNSISIIYNNIGSSISAAKSFIILVIIKSRIITFSLIYIIEDLKNPKLMGFTLKLIFFVLIKPKIIM